MKVQVQEYLLKVHHFSCGKQLAAASEINVKSVVLSCRLEL
jgi:hypothetical protein